MARFCQNIDKSLSAWYTIGMLYNVCIIGEPELCREMQQFGDKFSFECFATAHQLLKRLRATPANLLLLSAELPDMPGLELLRVIRETNYGRELPVIFLSVRKTKESLDEVFSLGVDDYLVKPFDTRELLVRMKAVLRRRFEAMESWGGPVTAGDIYIDPSQRKCIVDGKKINLRPLEFAVLEMFMLKAGRVLGRNYLLTNVWHAMSVADIRAVDTVVSRLRKALGKHGELIETVSKLGYCLNLPAEKPGKQ